MRKENKNYYAIITRREKTLNRRKADTQDGETWNGTEEHTYRKRTMPILQLTKWKPVNKYLA